MNEVQIRIQIDLALAVARLCALSASLSLCPFLRLFPFVAALHFLVCFWNYFVYFYVNLHAYLGYARGYTWPLFRPHTNLPPSLLLLLLLPLW